MSFDPRTLAQDLINHGNDWSDKRAAADILSETRKTVRAQIALRYLPDVKTQGKAELYAEADVEYLKHLQAMVEAEKQANKARCQYDADKAFIELTRSQESTRRSEMNLR